MGGDDGGEGWGRGRAEVISGFARRERDSAAEEEAVGVAGGGGASVEDGSEDGARDGDLVEWGEVVGHGER